MQYGCMVCNGIEQFAPECKRCHQKMKDLGRIEDYYSSYSPYEEQDSIAILQEATNACIHLIHCEECSYTKKIKIPYTKI
ncbi:hypothetical protein SAMN00017405_0167 [Desulfonispora thiosulfatigenes DSM 11270]|uniref:Uncharacterized protein n=1 Tax=Desulfonispora thiosulfatigenes DSM 11270 TaxID=656914 RepID=A0A1W1VMN4_DESTI|nr:hypothetical protein [Desulfonispora thiosulfatigenes]SMB94214.1 hypothetical protein SAMN00017405_0167 [Desulfonispora thiosulfatigenes DSM 11270]